MSKHERTPIVSAARTRLASTISARNEATEAMTHAQASLARLRTIQEEPGPIEQEIARLDEEETAAMSAWSRSDGESPAPTPNAELRVVLNASLAAAKAKAAAARRAEPSLSAEYVRETEKRNQIELWQNVGIGEALIESADPLLAEYEAANRALGAKAVRLAQLQEMVGDIARKLPTGSEQARQVFVALEEFTRALSRTLPRPGADDDAAAVSLTAWRDLADRLRDDATATLTLEG